jgi:hypothetical protein
MGGFGQTNILIQSGCRAFRRLVMNGSILRGAMIFIMHGSAYAADPVSDAIEFDALVEGGTSLVLYGRTGEYNYGVSSSDPAQSINFNQLYLSLGYPADGEKSPGFGFRFDNLVGTTWNQAHSYGFLEHSYKWNEVGWIPTQAYVEYASQIFDEKNVRVVVGNMYTPFGFENVKATDRPLYSTGYLYQFIYPATQFGLTVELTLNDRFTLYQGITNEADVWIGKAQRADYVGGFIAKPELSFDNELSLFVMYGDGLDRIDATYASGQPPIGIYSDNLAAPNTLSMVMLSEMWDLHIDDETQVTLDVTQGHIGAVSDVNGKGMLKPSMWAGGGIWVQKELDETFTPVIRAEVLYDSSGLQTGYAGTFMETTLGVGIKPLKYFLVRPEIRYDRAFGAEPYLDGTSHQNFSLNLDMILTLAQ